MGSDWTFACAQTVRKMEAVGGFTKNSDCGIFLHYIGFTVRGDLS